MLISAESYDLSTDKWTKLPNIPSAHCSAAHFVAKNKLYVMGGLSRHGLSGNCESLSFTN